MPGTGRSAFAKSMRVSIVMTTPRRTTPKPKSSRPDRNTTADELMMTETERDPMSLHLHAHLIS